MEQVILVNEQDELLGVMEKMEAHEKALLHRAFSVFVFNEKNELLLQQRAFTKYHSGGLWTNTCCSHPRPGESTEIAATRRLQEEMGFTTELYKAFSFTYKAAFDNGLTEHEFDHVFIGHYNGHVEVNPEEVAGYAYKSLEETASLLEADPANFTAWFHIAFPKIYDWYQQNYKS
ncbi:isopentenyl-diphosphate Delta-isomerase [Sediminibacterium goheungense]|uniref:Isopentenyl-diphosphate delta-isomerase n=1 Tax=Sediminibacterium goheungense TaxID=1086393 RepID=A0A4R6IWF2_9BACT|nr:isopentenyl-diphosphate Delta-isomerase [Sediminibacterium goheungense]TDO26671.1 isopentenyl-diphosphate delta-isomerase [Sediminibacterium goheungense]